MRRFKSPFRSHLRWCVNDVWLAGIASLCDSLTSDYAGTIWVLWTLSQPLPRKDEISCCRREIWPRSAMQVYYKKTSYRHLPTWKHRLLFRKTPKYPFSFTLRNFHYFLTSCIVLVKKISHSVVQSGVTTFSPTFLDFKSNSTHITILMLNIYYNIYTTYILKTKTTNIILSSKQYVTNIKTLY